MLTQELKDKVVESAVMHLMELLPLYSVSRSDAENQAIWYSVGVLEKLGREANLDKHWNIISPGTGNRAVVAHTDTVGSIDATAKKQSIRYNSSTGIIYNRSGFRAMGGDDKVGMAFALAIAEHIPETHVWLVANEEIGLLGSRAIEPGVKVDLAVQLDRRGSYALVTRITGPLCGWKTEKAAKALLPHRKDVNGGMTDVMALVDRDIAKTAFNMSCGYFNPHGSDEFIVMSLAIQSFIDGLVLLTCLADDDLEAPYKYQHQSRGNYGNTHAPFREREMCEGDNWMGDYCGNGGPYGDHQWDDEINNWASAAEIAARKKSKSCVTVRTAQGQLIDLDAKIGDPPCQIITNTWVTAQGNKLYRITEYADGRQGKEEIDPNEQGNDVLLAIASAYGDPFDATTGEPQGDIYDLVNANKWVATLGKLTLYHCDPNTKCSNCGLDCTTGICAVTPDNSARICEDCAYARGDELAFLVA